VVAQRHEGVIENVVRDASTLRDSLRLVERPVDAEIDAALAVLLFGLRQRPEAARHERPHVALVVDRHPVELVRDEREGDAIGPVEASQDLKQRASEAGVAGGIRGERRREVRSGQVAGGRAQRRERGIVVQANAGDGSPELVEVLRFPDRHSRIGHRDVDEGKEAGKSHHIGSSLVGDVATWL